MKIIIGTVLGSVLITIIFYIGLLITDKVLLLNIKRKEGTIVSFPVIATGILTFLGWFIICINGQICRSIIELSLVFFLVCGMAVLNVIDIEKHIIPNLVLKVMLLLWSVIVGITIILDTGAGITLACQALAGGIMGGAVFFLCYVLSGKRLGAGDVKLVFVMGLYLTGQRIMGVLLYGVLLCCIYSIVQLCRKKIGFKDGVPMTPFLYMGTVLAFIIL